MAGKAAALARVRKIIGAWPETREKISHGSPTWWGGRKTFATWADDHHGDGRVALWIKSTSDAREALLEMDGETFFVPPYVGPSGWLGMRVDRRPDWGVVEDLLLQGYRMVAPRRALRALDGG
jgi:hypothetical protein